MNADEWKDLATRLARLLRDVREQGMLTTSYVGDERRNKAINAALADYRAAINQPKEG